MPLTVLLLVNSFTRGGGAERLAIDLVRARPDGIRFVVCAIGALDSEEARSVRAELANHGGETASIGGGGGGRASRIAALVNVVRRHRVDLAHLHAISTAALPLIPLRVPYVYSFHAETVGGPHPRATQALEIVLAWSAARSVVVSRAMRDVAVRRTRLPNERLVVIANGVDLNRLQAERVSPAEVRARYGIPVEAPLVTVLARLDRNKRQDLVLDAVTRITQEQTHVVFAGSLGAAPGWVEMLRGRVADLGLGARVHFPGVVADAPSLLAASDALVSASESESFGIAPVEAMALGIPVVASDIPAHRESSDEGRNCLLFRSGDAAALAAALTRVLGREHGLDLDRISRDAIARYSIQRVAAEHAHLYRAMSAEPPIPFMRKAHPWH